MRKLLIAIGLVPSIIVKFCDKALKLTNTLIDCADSDTAKLIVRVTPTDVDDKVRLGIVAILNALVPIFQAAKDKRARKAIASRIGAEIVAEMDGRKEKTGYYVTQFEKNLNVNA